MKSNVVYIGSFCVSKMDAQSQLVIGNSRIFQELGYTVTLIGNDKTLAHNLNPLDNKIEVEGFDCYNVKFQKSIKGLLNSKVLFGQAKTIIESIGSENIAFVVCYGSLAFANQIYMLSQWCRRAGVPIIDNCVDLPKLKHGSLPQRMIKKLDRAFMNWTIANRMDGIIAVSHYIQNYFRRKTNCPTAVIPPLKDTQKFKLAERSSTNEKRLVYVGVPFPIDGRRVDESSYKDRIDLFIDLLCSVPHDNCRLDIYGLTKEQYLNVVQRHRKLLEEQKNLVVFHGRIGHDDAMRVMAEADYSIVYRLKNKMTMAGFSTKFVESICCGTPVIMTDTSEYVRYIEKGIASVLLDADDQEQQKKALGEALGRSQEEISAMKKKCYECRIFDYRNYVALMKEFLDLCLKEQERR